MSAGRLSLYRFIEDAWSGGLRTWCEAAGDFPGIASWILLENRGQERWFARKLGDAGITGIRLFDADGLRNEFSRLSGLNPVAMGSATAAFVVASAARQTGSEPAPTAAGNSAALAEACDALARAGWHLNQLAIDSVTKTKLQKFFDRSPTLTGFFERRLREALSAIPARICCVGWDAAHWPDIQLLDIAASKAAAFEMYVPSPRLPADAQQRVWIESLEQRLGLERATCPESTFNSQNEPLVARLEKSELADRGEATRPTLLVGREWSDQVRLVCGQVKTWLAENPANDSPIGIISCENSPTAVAVAEALANAGIKIEHPGRARDSAPETSDATGFEMAIIEQVARYHLKSHDVGELLQLIHLLWLDARRADGSAEKWGVLEPEAARDALDRAFQAAQSRNSRILARSLPHRKDLLWKSICDLVEVLGRWNADEPWSALSAQWSGLLTGLGEPSEFTASWLQLPAFADHDRISGRLFMEGVAAHIAAQRVPAPPDFSIAAPVAVTTFAQAAQQTWQHLIFLDSNENVWPVPIRENPYLTDAVRLRLNANRRDSGCLLTTHDQRALDQAHFLDLLEHCRGPIVFAGVLLEQTETGDHAQPNEWVLRSLLETTRDGDSFPMNFWRDSAQTFPPEQPPALDPAELAHLQRIHLSRQNGTMPFDRYQFNFHESKLQPEAWSATGLDEAITCPATFALRELFGAESTANWSPKRGEAAAVGNRAHRWLSRILGMTDLLGTPESDAADESKVARELAAARVELEEWYATEGLVLPIWWESCLRKTAWATRRCLREIRPWLPERYCATERNMKATVRTPNGPLKLKGRVDILLSDLPDISDAHLRIFDFKTGRSQAPTLASLEKGNGAQFAAYYLMARDQGAADAVVGIIKPEERARDVFSSADETNLRARFGHFADLWRDLRFGRRGPLISDYGVCETLPLATVPIDPAILEQKAGLFLLAS